MTGADSTDLRLRGRRQFPLRVDGTTMTAEITFGLILFGCLMRPYGQEANEVRS
jgi:hypothetical protein